MKRPRQRGNSVLEFTLVCIPLIFLIVSIEELSRGMWLYSTVAHSVKKGTRFASVHGELCAGASSSCPATIGDLAQVIRISATGLDPGQFNVVLESAGSSQSCAPLSNCLGNATAWPPTADRDVGLPVTISATYPFRSAIAMFWPGQAGIRFASVTLGAKSREEITF